MLSKRSLENSIPQELSLADALRSLAEELNHCSQTLRETHQLVAPQLDELEQHLGKAATTPGNQPPTDPRRAAPRDSGQVLSLKNDQRSLGRA